MRSNPPAPSLQTTSPGPFLVRRGERGAAWVLPLTKGELEGVSIRVFHLADPKTSPPAPLSDGLEQALRGEGSYSPSLFPPSLFRRGAGGEVKKGAGG